MALSLLLRQDSENGWKPQSLRQSWSSSDLMRWVDVAGTAAIRFFYFLERD